MHKKLKNALVQRLNKNALQKLQLAKKMLLVKLNMKHYPLALLVKLIANKNPLAVQMIPSKE